MDDQNEALNPTAGEATSEPTAPVDEPKATEEAETPVDEATADTTAETDAKTEESPKKGASQRIRELNAKAKSAEEKAKSLEQRLAELTGSVDPHAPQVPTIPQAPVDEPIVRDGEELTPAELERRIQQRDERLTQRILAQTELRNKQSEAINRINTEATQVIQAFPQLDPESDSFDPELSDAVTEATEAYVRANPYTASPKKFVEKMMKPFQRSVTKEVGKVSENIAKQVTQTATRPTSVTTKGGKSDAEKSIKELEAEIGFYN